MWSQLPTTKRLVALPVLAILLVNVAFAGTAVAEPRIWVVSSSLDRDTTLVGEDVPVKVHLKNSGDGGGFSVEVRANDSVVTSERFQVESNTDKNVRIPISLDEPGVYKIRANDRGAGTLEVTRVRASTVSDRDDGRTTSLRAGNASAGETLTADLSAAPNQSFVLEELQMTTSGSPFNRSVATYAPADGAPFTTPSAEGSTVVGAIDADSIAGVNTTSVRVAIDRDSIREAGLGTGEVAVYRKSGENYVPLSTTQAETTSETVVYEASTDGGDQFVVGTLSPRFTVRSKAISTSSTADGQRMNLSVTVANSGPVEGEYTGEMRVDGTAVDDRTASIPAGETTTMTLTHVVTEQGDYEVALGSQSAGSVVITGDQVSSDESSSTESASTESESSDTDTGTAEEENPDAGGLTLPSLDDVSMIELGIGAGIVLLGGGLIVVLRR